MNIRKSGRIKARKHMNATRLNAQLTSLIEANCKSYLYSARADAAKLISKNYAE